MGLSGNGPGLASHQRTELRDDEVTTSLEGQPARRRGREQGVWAPPLLFRPLHWFKRCNMLHATMLDDVACNMLLSFEQALTPPFLRRKASESDLAGPPAVQTRLPAAEGERERLAGPPAVRPISFLRQNCF